MMSSQNYFDLLGDDENEEPTAVIARATVPHPAEKLSAKKPQTTAVSASPGRLLSKPTPPPEATREQKPFEGGRGRGGGRGGRGGNRGGYGDRDREAGFQRDSRDGYSRDRPGHNNDRHFSASNSDVLQGNRASGLGVEADAVLTPGVAVHGAGYGAERPSRVDGENWSAEGNRGRGSRSGGRGRDRDRGLGSDGEERLRRREFDRRSGSGFGNEIKRDGTGRGNWGAEGEQASRQDVVAGSEFDKGVLEGSVEGKADPEIDVEGGEPAVDDGLQKKEAEDEDNELTLDEYEKILEEKRKALSGSKVEERKVEADKAFASMQLVDKKNDEDVFIKLGSEKEKKKKEKETFEKEEKARKTKSINEFLKHVDGEKSYASPGNRGRGRGRGRGREARVAGASDGERVAGPAGRGSFSGGFSSMRRVSAPRIEDPGQFPNLGAK